MASQARKKDEGPPRWMVVRFRGRMRKRHMTGRIERSLDVPLGIALPMVWQ